MSTFWRAASLSYLQYSQASHKLRRQAVSVVGNNVFIRNIATNTKAKSIVSCSATQQNRRHISMMAHINRGKTTVIKRMLHQQRYYNYGTNNSKNHLLRDGIFTVGVGFTAFAIAAIVKSERLDNTINKIWRKFYNFCNNNNMEGYFKPIYDNTTVTNFILASHGIIFGAHQISSFNNTMRNNFMSSIYNRNPRALLLSTFSHATLPHLALNSLALYSFGPILLAKLNYSHEDLLALYVTAGTVSSYGSNVYNVLRRPVHMGIPGLGASGALLACAAILSEDDALKFSIIFLPMITMTGKQIVALISAVDVVGLIRGWTTIGHAAHLSGTLFGIWFVYGNGRKLISRYENFVFQEYRKLRNKR
jgi:membrane associated rhomboid family serine protease